MKKILALVLAVLMIVTVFAGCNDTTTDNTKYTYNSYTTALGTNWNPHAWETNADSSIMSYIESPLVDISIKDSTTGEYQWIYVAATEITDVTEANQADLDKYGVILPAGATSSADVTEGYVYEIKLRPEMCWEDGTAINADTYIYSMKALLDPAMKNYRANLYYNGESAVAGALEYFYQGSTAFAVVNSDGENVTYQLSDLTKGDDGIYETSDGMDVAFGLTTGYGWMGGNSLSAYANAGYIPVEVWDGLKALADDEGFVPVTDESMDLLHQFTGSETWGFETKDDLVYYMNIAKTYPEASFDTVGLYKVDDYTIRYVCESAYDYYYFLTSCTSNWLVYEKLYEEGKETTGDLVTTTYGTSKDTTMSYGPYKMASLEDNKEMVFVQNEKYWEYTKNEDGTLSSTTFFTVDGEKKSQFMTEKIVIKVMTDDAAKLAFLSGQLDDWAPAADEVVNYATSDQLYQVDETYTMRFFFNHNLEKLQAMDQAGNQNSVVLSNYNFRKAMSLALNRTEWVTATAGYKPAYSLINSLYFYDVYEDPSSIYRNTDEAMQSICDLYGVTYGEGTPYADLKAAYDSITGYNLTEAKALMTQACDELVEAGLYTEGEAIKIQVGFKAGAMDSSDQQQMALFNQQLNAALEGTGFGTIELVGLDNLSDRYTDVMNGVYAIGYGAWGGAAFYPFTMFQVYCDPDMYDIHESGCWDPASETLTLTVNGEETTMTWQDWSGSMTGTGKFANADNETKLYILSQLEKNYLELYHCIPLASTTACSMLSYKLSYYTENYSIMYGFGGMRLLNHNYTDAEWAEYVSSQGGTLTY